MKKWLVCAVVCAMGAAAWPSFADEVAAIQEGKAYFLQRLKDPDSAQWRNLRAETVRKDGKTTHVLCGELNAKNSYGGYVGFRPFWYFGGNGEILKKGDDLFFRDFSEAICP